MTHQIFVPGVGQFENIGDIILRRQLLSRMRRLGKLHIYVGSSSDDYDSALELSPEDRVYRSFRRWYFAALRATASGAGSYVFKPGEIQLTMVGLKEHLSMLPVIALARLRKKPVVRIGSGSRNFAKLPRAFMWPSVKLSSLVLWRDTKTASFFRGATMPDLAFGEGSSAEVLAEPRSRDVLVISMRSDRAPTPQNWVDGVKAFAAQRKLDVFVVSQVIRDNPKTLELSERIGGKALIWDGTDHRGRESLLRDLYRRSEIAVSDRLHVLVAAFTEGALPAAVLTDGSDKVARHFAAAGINGIDLPTTETTPAASIVQWLSRISPRRDSLMAALTASRQQLDAVFARVGSLYGNEGGDRKAVGFAYQVGRAGEVAGGMTQVVNAYLGWNFDDFEPKLITSRGEYSTPVAVGVFLRAIIAVLCARRVSKSVLVVHLSQGGSFAREGVLLRLGRARGFATVAQIHGSSFVEYAARHRAQVSKVLRRAHGIHVLSDESAAVARQIAPRSTVKVIPNAVSEGVARSKTPAVIFAGAVGQRKGVDVLLDAWAPEFADAGWTLTVVGPVADPQVIPDELPPAVEILGPLEHRDVMALLESSKVAVLPSRDEAMPMFIIEAMARSNAVVSTLVGGIPKVVDETVGILVPPGDSSALRGALKSVMGASENSDRYQRGALDAFRRTYSAETVIPLLNDFWLATRAAAKGVK